MTTLVIACFAILLVAVTIRVAWPVAMALLTVCALVIAAIVAVLTALVLAVVWVVGCILAAVGPAAYRLGRRAA